MREIILTSEEVLRGYDAVSTLYPHVPSLSHWRAWEYAAYRHFELDGRCLDLGCGDGRYFGLLWPDAADTVGVEIDPDVARAGIGSGVYRTIHVAPASHVPEEAASFDHVFANCSLEHMDALDSVLSEVRRCLRPGGSLLCSVVTNRFVEWSLLPEMVRLSGHEKAASALQDDFLRSHHLANPLTVRAWEQHFAAAGLTVECHVPILPQYNSGFFLLADTVWHVRTPDGGELGGVIHPFLAANPLFPRGLRSVIAGLLDMERDRRDCSGAVFLVRKLAGSS